MIQFLKKGGIDTSDATATANDIMNPKTAYINGEKVTGTMPNKGAQVFTPTISQQTLPTGYYNGATISAVTKDVDSNIQAENVKKGVTILGITGTYEGTGGNAVINTVMSGSGSEAIKSSIIELPLLNVSQITNLSGLFSGYKSLVNFSLTDTSHIINMSAMFSNCTNLVSVPSLDTSNVVNMSSMFERCSSLENVPVLNMAKVIYLSNMFLQSFALSDNSLDNIMESCITVTDAYTGNKTLKTLGINSTLANRCSTLSNYQAFLDAGWSTGY